VTTSVLVVDDDPTFRRLAVRMLERMGLAVVGQAATAAEGVEIARALRPEAVLVDVGLPDGSGTTLAVELAGLAWRPRIVLTSNDPGALTEAVARAAGAVAFIAKQELPDCQLGALLAGGTQQE
jgi:CheY-like chemotaxis protein